MKFSLSWLKEHLETTADAATIAETLNRIGLEVESVDNPAERLAGFRIARVLSAEPHPQADKLKVLSVDAGDGPMQVVCGAPNARAGLVGVFGAPGAVVPASGMVLKVAAIRGVESNGMMCSARELELGDDHDGIIELAGDAPVGSGFAAWAGADDPVFDIAITPNRQDCMGVRGIARDLAAAGLGTLRPLAQVYKLAALEPVPGTDPAPDVATLDAEGCPAFFAQNVSGLKNGASPDWMVRKLKAAGQKPISVLVDITNFVSLDLGRPLHVYDRSTLKGPLVARKAKDGEQVLALNGKTYTLDALMTVIADDERVHDIGGIMGGEHSGVTDRTTDILIECAWFTPEHIARTGQKLALTSDARTRFERGVDPAFLEDGLAIATRLVLDHCGGTASAITRAGQPPCEQNRVSYDPALAARLGGIEASGEEQLAILDRLGFETQKNHAWQIVVPSWRRDVDGPADIVEEIVRIAGMDRVPSTPLPRAEGVARPTATPEQLVERRLRRTAAARGSHEAVTWSFIAEREAAAFGGGAWSVANPISEDMKVMRPSLLPGLLSAAARNLNRGSGAVRLFEIGRRYLADGEHPSLAIVMTGEAAPRQWQTGKARGFDAFDAKAEALALLEAAGVPVDKLQVAGDAGATWHPGQSATLRLGPKTVLAAFGMVHPLTARAFDIDQGVAAVELFLDAIPARRRSGFMRPAYAPPPLQAVQRDFALLAPAGLALAELIRAVRGADKAAITDVRLFDRFTGTGVAEGEVSLAIEVTLQPVEKSFTDAELKAVSERIVAAAAKLGARLRT